VVHRVAELLAVRLATVGSGLRAAALAQERFARWYAVRTRSNADFASSNRSYENSNGVVR
jgi:hypothetical protein